MAIPLTTRKDLRITGTGVEVIDAKGRVRSGRDPLDIEGLLAA